MFILGTYEYNVDERGRVAIPARYRDALGPMVVIARGPDGCLEVYSPAEFQRKAEALFNGSPPRQKDRRLGRAVFGGAAEAEIDKQGRALIPATLRQWAGLAGPVVIVGQGTFLEVWSAGRWQAEEPAIEESFAQTIEMKESR